MLLIILHQFKVVFAAYGYASLNELYDISCTIGFSFDGHEEYAFLQNTTQLQNLSQLYIYPDPTIELFKNDVSHKMMFLIINATLTKLCNSLTLVCFD